MKKWKQIILEAIAALVIIFSFIYVFLIFFGKSLIIKSIEESTHKKTTIEYFGLTPPLHLQIRNLNIEGMAKVDSIYITPSILGFIRGYLAFNSLILEHPEFTYTKSPAAIPTSSTDNSELIAQEKVEFIQKAKKETKRLIIKSFKVKDGKLYFIDNTVGPEALRITVKDINISIKNMFTIRQAVSNFNLSAKIPWRETQEEGSIQLDGWINFHKKDVRADLKIENIDGIYLYPYYSKWVDLDKARIDRAKLTFISNIHGLNNNLTAECHLELTDIVRKPLEEGESEEKAAKITDAVLDIFKAMNQGKIVLDFTIHTKMNRPEFGFGDIKMAFEDKIKSGRGDTPIKVAKDIAAFPTTMLQTVVKGATDLSKSVLDGVYSVGAEIKKLTGKAIHSVTK